MADNNPDLAAQEVDEELRRDQLNALWKTYGRYIIGGAVGIVLAVAGNEIYTSQVENAQEDSSRVFEGAVVDSGADGSDPATIWNTALPKLEGGYLALGELRFAQQQAGAGDYTGAIATYDSIASNSAHDVVLTDFAKLMAALLVAEKVGNLDEANSRLSIIAVKGMPWYYSALEQVAFIDMQQGRSEDALSKFSRLAGDTETPPSISGRAAQFRDLLEEQQRTAELTNTEATGDSSEN